MGLVFREAGSRDKARQALGLAAKVAGANAAPVQEAEARLHLARFYIEALPTQGKERGEALRAAREAADQALGLARALGRDDLEAGAEEVLGELSWRAEDWDEALASLERQQGAWRRAGRASKEVDAAIRSSRLAARREQWDEAFASANSALMQATRKRLPEQTAQGQMARAEALAGMGRKDEALAALTEAQRIFGSLGEEFAAQGRAAEQRARRLIAGD
jgi:tetratricopeptide (TPR) repeat protein